MLLQNPREGLLIWMSSDGTYVRVWPVCTIHKVQLECTGTWWMAFKQSCWDNGRANERRTVNGSQPAIKGLLCIHQCRHHCNGCTRMSWLHPCFTVFVLLQMLLFRKQKISAVNYVNVNLCLFLTGYTHEWSTKWQVPASFATHQSLLACQGKETRLGCIKEQRAETKAPALIRQTRASRTSPIKFQWISLILTHFPESHFPCKDCQTTNFAVWSNF